jgi:ubiquinone/menaquinone biosynthesis C-methylase UbiE
MALNRDFTAPYSAAEAWIYDRYIAAAVSRLVPASGEKWMAELTHGAKVLDVGCGGGQNLVALAQRRPDLELTGLDLNSGQVARASRRAAKQGVAMRCVEGSALDLPFDDGEFDAVVSIASIKHWPDQSLGLAECVRVLKSGGKLVVVEADRGCYLDDARSFCEGTRIPRPFRRLFLLGFRTFVAGQGLDLDDARRLLADLPLAESTAERIPGAPAIAIEGRAR